MGLKNRGRVLAAGVLAAGVVIGAGVVTVTPAGAVVKDAASTVNWKNIWKTEIKPRADKRYYTKKNANSTFVKSSALTTILSAVRSPGRSAGNAALGTTTPRPSRTRTTTPRPSPTRTTTRRPRATRSTRRSPSPTVDPRHVRPGRHGPAGRQPFADSLDFGFTLSAAPTVHYIKAGDPRCRWAARGTRAHRTPRPATCASSRLSGRHTSPRVTSTTPPAATRSASPFGANVLGVLDRHGTGLSCTGRWAVTPGRCRGPRVRRHRAQAGGGGARTGN